MLCVLKNNQRFMSLLRVHSPFETNMTSVGDYEIKPPIYKSFIEKNKCMHTNGRLENGLNVINASATCT